MAYIYTHTHLTNVHGFKMVRVWNCVQYICFSFLLAFFPIVVYCVRLCIVFFPIPPSIRRFILLCTWTTNNKSTEKKQYKLPNKHENSVEEYCDHIGLVHFDIGIQWFLLDYWKAIGNNLPITQTAAIGDSNWAHCSATKLTRIQFLCTCDGISLFA